MTTTRQNPFLLVLAVMAFLLGCAQAPSGESGLSRIVCPETGQGQAFAAAQEAVKSMYFVIDEADLQTGYIKTLPLSGAQGFELWRSDSAGMFNTVEASLQSIRRTAELQITAHDKDVHINCVVTTQRLNMPGRQASSSSQAYRIHSDSTRAIQRLKLTPAQERNMVWTDLGPDQRLAQRILNRIRRRLSRSLSENPVVGPRASGFVTGKDGEAGDIAVYRRWSRTPTSRKTSRSKPDRILRQAPRVQIPLDSQT